MFCKADNEAGLKLYRKALSDFDWRVVLIRLIYTPILHVIKRLIFTNLAHTVE